MVMRRAVATIPDLTAPAPFGLLSVARDLTGELPDHWAAGITYEALCAGVGSTYDECIAVTGVGSTPAPPAKEPTYDYLVRGATPFTVIARKDCSAPGFWEDLPDEIRRALAEGEQWQVERSFWTGLAGGQTVVYPHLAADSELLDDQDILLQLEADEVSGSAVDVILALSLLEAALADCYQGQGVIHAPAEVGPHLAAWGLIELVGGRYVTKNGNLVALGRGYPGTAPDGSETSNVSWMYATGAVFYARGEMLPFTRIEMLDRDNNTIEALAERTYLVGWDCCLLGVPVDLTATTGGGSGGGVSDVEVTNFPASYPQPSVQRSTLTTRLTGGADRAIPADRRSYSVAVIAAAGGGSPTLDGTVLQAGESVGYEADGNNTLAAASVLTTAGDVVLVLEMF